MAQTTSSSENNIPEDVITKVTGNFGRWQLRTIILIFLCKIPTSWFTACIIYTAPTGKLEDYFCESPQNSYLNSSTKSWIRVSYSGNPERNTDKEFETELCNIKKKYFSNTNNFLESNISESQIVPCNNDNGYTSLVTDFNLFCSRQLLISLTQSFHAFGALIGGLIATILLDHISPRMLMLLGMILQIVCGNLTGLVNKFELHVFFRCATSACCALMYTSGQVIFSDITAGKAKTIVTTLFELFWSIGLILLPGISIFVDSWTYLYVAISSPTIILVFLHRWISDSPRWLLKKGQFDRALQILLEAAAFNNKHIPLDIEERLKIYAEEQKQLQSAKYCSIWHTKTKRRYIFAVHWAWVWSVMLYNAMILNIRAFGVDHIHVNTVVLGFSEMLGVFIGLFFILYTRKRWLWSGYLISIAGCLTFFIWLVPSSLEGSRRVGLEMIFCIGLKIANAASLSILVTCTGEMVSPDKRRMLMFSVVTWSRIWLLFAPFVIATSIIYPLIPITVLAILAVFNGLFMCFLNSQYWNHNQPRIERVPTLTTFRRHSALLQMKRNSTCSELNGGSTIKLGTASISDIWTIAAENIKIDELKEDMEKEEANTNNKI